MKTQSNFQRIFRNAVRLYFAPLTGAYREVCSELDRINREREQIFVRRAENKPE